jgi:hypothetical protein
MRAGCLVKHNLRLRAAFFLAPLALLALIAALPTGIRKWLPTCNKCQKVAQSLDHS